MIFHSWVPKSVVNQVTTYFNQPSGATKFEIKTGDGVLDVAEMWKRLAMCHEMETVWKFISTRNPSIELTSNGGLLGKVNRAMASYLENPKLTPADYKTEMKEIAKLSELLARKIKKFDGENGAYTTFPLHSLLNNHQLAQAEIMMRPEVVSGNNVMRGKCWILDYCMPSISTQIEALAKIADSESKQQNMRFKLPRKVKGKNAFRTYFVRIVADYFFCMYADYSPARLSIFCSTALDDVEITPDLIRKLYPLDRDQKSMLATQSE